MTEFTYYIILSLIVLPIILFVNFKPWWKYLNLTVFILYISISINGIYTDKHMDGFVEIILTLIIMMIHLGILLISIIFFYNLFLEEKEWK